MQIVRLVQIPKPLGSQEVLERPADAAEDMGPFILGGGDVDLVCGKCETVLAAGMESDRPVRDVVFRCQNCGAYNQIASWPE